MKTCQCGHPIDTHFVQSQRTDKDKTVFEYGVCMYHKTCECDGLRLMEVKTP
jgi:hypothetical protein